MGPPPSSVSNTDDIVQQHDESILNVDDDQVKYMFPEDGNVMTLPVDISINRSIQYITITTLLPLYSAVLITELSSAAYIVCVIVGILLQSYNNKSNCNNLKGEQYLIHVRRRG